MVDSLRLSHVQSNYEKSFAANKLLHFVVVLKGYANFFDFLLFSSLLSSRQEDGYLSLNLKFL